MKRISQFEFVTVSYKQLIQDDVFLRKRPEIIRAIDYFSFSANQFVFGIFFSNAEIQD